MTLNAKENRTLRNQKLSDIELVELAGFYAYKEIRKDKVFIVDEKGYLIIDVVSDSKTGLDGFTVQNQTIIFGGGFSWGI